MEKKAKKRYEKPTLKGATAFEAAGALCCKATVGTCAVAARNTAGKATRTLDAS